MGIYASYTSELDSLRNVNFATLPAADKTSLGTKFEGMKTTLEGLLKQAKADLEISRTALTSTQRTQAEQSLVPREPNLTLSLAQHVSILTQKIEGKEALITGIQELAARVENASTALKAVMPVSQRISQKTVLIGALTAGVFALTAGAAKYCFFSS